MGITSRGVFIKTAIRWILFLSFEKFRGPLTINIGTRLPELDERSMGEVVQITPGLIFIPKADLLISTRDAAVWQPVPPSSAAPDSAKILARMRNFAMGAYQQKQGAGLSTLLPLLFSFPSDSPGPTKIAQDLKVDILSIQQEIRISDLTYTTANIKKILGRGEGLTPSGDDFVIGMLLCLNHWKDMLKVDGDLQIFNGKVIAAAYEATTTLSGNLIECATQGLADERLVNAIDYLITGAGRQERILNELLSWGNSSGVDALVGMALVMSAVNIQYPPKTAQ